MLTNFKDHYDSSEGELLNKLGPRCKAISFLLQTVRNNTVKSGFGDSNYTTAIL